MPQSQRRLLAFIAFGSFILIIQLPLVKLEGPVSFLVQAFLLYVATMAALGIYRGLKRLAPWIDASALAQAKFLDSLTARQADVAIVFAAVLSLFVELAIIRWQSSVLPFLAFYKNFSLLACFVGLGLGYALATRDRIPLFIVLPLLAWQFLFMSIMRYLPGQPISINPVNEQLTWGLVLAVCFTFSSCISCWRSFSCSRLSRSCLWANSAGG